tara:strand:+ start:1625 stop:1948 length:324 start_codon:yes stop_codon:yes gene_type:complete
MAKATIGTSATDKALNNVLGQIKRIHSAEKRGESLENLSHYFKKPVTQKPKPKADLKLTMVIASRPMRTKRKKKTIDPALAKLELLSIETGVPLELLKRNPNFRLKK